MQEYENKRCDCCGEKFQKDDEIVVCPECGTPIHKKCWNGHCPNEARHAEGFDWEAQQAEESQEKPAGQTAVYCEICGQPFTEGDDIVYCPDCGTPTHRECRERLGRCPNETRHAEGFSWSAQRARPLLMEQWIESLDPELFQKESGAEHTCFGVRPMELIHFLGVRNFSTPRFYTLFFSMADTGRKISFNFFAGLLMPFYQFYRKMAGPSALLAAAVLVMGIPQLVMQTILMLRQNAAAVPAELYAAAEIFSYVHLILQIAVILFNDYIYMKWSVGKILSLREQYQGAPEADYMQALERAGKPSFALALIGVTALSVLSYVLLSVLSVLGYFS